MASDLRLVAERVGKSYKQVHGLYKRLVQKINKLLLPFNTSVSAADYSDLYAAIHAFGELTRSIGHPSTSASDPAREYFARSLHSSILHFRSERSARGHKLHRHSSPPVSAAPMVVDSPLNGNTATENEPTSQEPPSRLASLYQKQHQQQELPCHGNEASYPVAQLPHLPQHTEIEVPAKQPNQGFGTPPGNTPKQVHASDLHDDNKLTLRLSPADERSRSVVAALGEYEHVQLRVPRTKRTASLLRHLRNKWSRADSLAADLVLLRSDSRQKSARIPESSESIASVLGSSATDVNLWYRWCDIVSRTGAVMKADTHRHKRRKRIEPERIGDVGRDEIVASRDERAPLQDLRPNCDPQPVPSLPVAARGASKAALEQHQEQKEEEGKQQEQQKDQSPVTSAAAWINREEEAMEEEALLTSLSECEVPDLFSHVDTSFLAAVLPGGGTQVLDPVDSSESMQQATFEGEQNSNKCDESIVAQTI